LHRENLITSERIMTTKVLFHGKKAIGVEFIRQLDFPFTDYVESSTREKLYCQGDVILAGGAINTPQLLLLSGVGPGQHLRDYSIPIIQDMPGVGSNLQDHLEIYVQQVAFAVYIILCLFLGLQIANHTVQSKFMEVPAQYDSHRIAVVHKSDWISS
jgi:choline dehydrogenase-like flavoprotein